MNKKNPTTFDRIMKDPVRKKKIDAGYKRFLLSELLISLMEQNDYSVRDFGYEVALVNKKTKKEEMILTYEDHHIAAYSHI